MANRLIVLIFMSFLVLFARDKIEVKARDYFLDEKKGEALLSGDVVITRAKDVLKSGKLKIKMNGKKAVRYEASNKPSFHIYLGDKIYDGKGDIFIYDVPSDTYEIIGHAYIKEAKTKKELMGEKIIIDRKKLIYRVQSDEKRPAKFIFELDGK